MSTEPFDVDFAAWIHSHKGSRMWSIGPRDVRHEHCFWWSPGFSNSKFANKRVSLSGKVRTTRIGNLYRTSIVVHTWRLWADIRNSGCHGQNASECRVSIEWSHHFRVNPSPLQLRGFAILRFRHGKFRLFQLESAGTWFQSSHSKLPNCNHVGVASESMFCWCFLLWLSFVFEDQMDEKNVEKMKNDTFRSRPFQTTRWTKKSDEDKRLTTKTPKESFGKNAPEAKTRRLRGRPWERCGTWWCASRTAGRVCRRSPRRTRCWEPCGGTRKTETSRASAAMRCTSSAGISPNSASRCSATPPSMPRCAPRRRWRHGWRGPTSTQSNSVCGCSRRASSGGDGCLRGGRPSCQVRKSQRFSSQFYNSHSSHWLLL